MSVIETGPGPEDQVDLGFVPKSYIHELLESISKTWVLDGDIIGDYPGPDAPLFTFNINDPVQIPDEQFLKTLREQASLALNHRDKFSEEAVELLENIVNGLKDAGF
jgi:hypothetical protein